MTYTLLMCTLIVCALTIYTLMLVTSVDFMRPCDVAGCTTCVLVPSNLTLQSCGSCMYLDYKYYKVTSHTTLPFQECVL